MPKRRAESRRTVLGRTDGVPHYFFSGKAFEMKCRKPLVFRITFAVCNKCCRIFQKLIKAREPELGALLYPCKPPRCAPRRGRRPRARPARAARAPRSPPRARRRSRTPAAARRPPGLLLYDSTGRAVFFRLPTLASCLRFLWLPHTLARFS